MSAGLSLLTPFLITLITIDAVGTAWQGRYTLAFSVGTLVLVGMAFETKAPRHRLVGPALFGIAACLTLGHLLSIVEVQLSESNNPAVAGVAMWPLISPVLTALLAAAGLLMWIVALRSPRATTDGPVVPFARETIST
jgi:lipopolysaccharide export LptBFGC system permease protein LptF